MVENNNQDQSGHLTEKSFIPLDFTFIKVPYEQARKVFRHSQRILEQKLGLLTKEFDQGAALSTLTDLVNSLENEDRIEGRLFRGKCQKRLKFYGELANSPEEGPLATKWNQIKVNRFLVDYLYSEGHFESASALSEHCNLKNLEYDDGELYSQLIAIENELHSKSTSECLLWCFENRPHLKKSQSSLEFLLRRQTFVELARKRDLIQAITYAKKFFPPWLDRFGREIEQVTALLAISPQTQVEPYKSLYRASRWNDLVAIFRREFLDLHSVSQRPVLISNLQAGLSSLKTPFCLNSADCNINCPVCLPPYSEIAEGLPFSHHENSTIVCRITGQVMNEDNPPMVLPNGRVYSRDALYEMATTSGKITCPVTDQLFEFSQAKKVFIL